MRPLLWLIGLTVVASPFAAARGDEITPGGHRLAGVLDEMNVERLWLSQRYVDWKTGEPLNKPVTDSKPHTHCSAFVAAACFKLGVYILRPPEHSATLLANAQFDWLGGAGKKEGWKAVKTAAVAQRLANRGQLVVASYKEHDPARSGHIAIVRPSAKSAELIQRDGPQVIQAGLHNHNNTSLKDGFKAHPSAWRDHEVRFFVHDIPAK